jgi:hypothetical protein
MYLLVCRTNGLVHKNIHRASLMREPPFRDTICSYRACER